MLEKGSYISTTDLAYAIAGCYPSKLRHGRIHPATKTFQALRIEVNKELNFDLVITDLYGREIKVLEENSEKVIFSRENLESGFYFFNILINGINVHRERVVLLK